jgi:hypothetical protein
MNPGTETKKDPRSCSNQSQPLSSHIKTTSKSHIFRASYPGTLDSEPFPHVTIVITNDKWNTKQDRHLSGCGACEGFQST